MTTLDWAIGAVSLFFSLVAIFLGTGDRTYRYGLEGFDVAAAVLGMGFFLTLLSCVVYGR